MINHVEESETEVRPTYESVGIIKLYNPKAQCMLTVWHRPKTKLKHKVQITPQLSKGNETTAVALHVEGAHRE